MRTIVWAPSFRRAFRRYRMHFPHAIARVQDTLSLLAEDPFAPSLDTHKLKGKLEGLWACSAAYDCRIVFEFVRIPDFDTDGILLIDIGTHDEVY